MADIRDQESTTNISRPADQQLPAGASRQQNHVIIALLAKKHDEELISRREAAGWLGVCPHTLARAKSLHPIKFNARLLRYRVGDLREYIRAASVK